MTEKKDYKKEYKDLYLPNRLFLIVLFFLLFLVIFAQTNQNPKDIFKFNIIRPGEVLISLNLSLYSTSGDLSLLNEFIEPYTEYELNPTNIAFTDRGKVYLHLFKFKADISPEKLNNFLMMLNSDKSIISVDKTIIRQAISGRWNVTPRPPFTEYSPEWAINIWINGNLDQLVEMGLLIIHDRRIKMNEND